MCYQFTKNHIVLSFKNHLKLTEKRSPLKNVYFFKVEDILCSRTAFCKSVGSTAFLFFFMFLYVGLMSSTIASVSSHISLSCSNISLLHYRKLPRWFISDCKFHCFHVAGRRGNFVHEQDISWTRRKIIVRGIMFGKKVSNDISRLTEFYFKNKRQAMLINNRIKQFCSCFLINSFSCLL